MHPRAHLHVAAAPLRACRAFTGPVKQRTWPSRGLELGGTREIAVAAAVGLGARRLGAWSSARRPGRSGVGPRCRRVRTALRVFDRFREDAVTAVYNAQEEAVKRGYTSVSSELLLYGILSDEQKGGNRVAKAALRTKKISREKVARAIDKLEDERGRTAPKGGGRMPFADDTKQILDSVNADTPPPIDIGCEHLLLAVGLPANADSGAAKVLLDLGFDGEALRAAVREAITKGPGAGDDDELALVGADGEDGSKTLSEVTTDLTALAEEGKLDPMVGREAETERMVQILLRRRKNNACLVGPPGVGKTAVAEGLAQRLTEGNVPQNLKGRRVLSLDLGKLVAGSKYRGEFEKRVQDVLDGVLDAEPEIILFIDEMHQLVGAGSAGDGSSMDAANMLKPVLARGELRIVGATTADEYAKYIEKDGALERRFQKVTVDELTVPQTVTVLEGLRRSYEEHHECFFSPEAILAAAKLSDRYLGDRRLPDKAIDVLDEAGSLAQIRSEELRAKEDEQQSAGETESIAEDEPVISEWETVTTEDVASVVSGWSGVPLDRLTEAEGQRLLRLEERLRERLIGQWEAVNALGRAVRRTRVGMSNIQRPIAVLYFAGPTGVGKTELCKVLAAEYYLDAKAMIRLDMSEYSEQHSVSRLIGSPPGYVGFDDPRSGQLTESVRRMPYSVVVFDEIEKAHPQVLNLFLQIMEDGRLTDSKGQTVSFTNCIIIMTSNVGAQQIIQSSGDYAAARAAVQDQLQKNFKPEFVNRLDELLVFRALSDADNRQIARLMLGEAVERFAQPLEMEAADAVKRPRLGWTSAFEDHVLAIGTDAAYGARPLRRAVQRLFEDAVAEVLVTGAFVGGEEASVDFDGEGVVVRCGDNETRPSRLSSLVVAAGEKPAPSQVPVSPTNTEENGVPLAVQVS